MAETRQSWAIEPFDRLRHERLIDALRRAEFLATKIGIRAVEVDAINDDAKRFYERYGFLTLKDDPRHLYLPMTLIRKLQLPPI